MKLSKICPMWHNYYKSSACYTCPICEKNNKPLDGFLSYFSAPVRRALQNEGINNVEKLAQYTQKDILKLHGIGKSSLPIFQKILSENSLQFQ